MNIAVLGGGNSGEREVSLKSLKNVTNILSKNSNYQVFPIVVTGNKFTYENENQEVYIVDLNDFSLTIHNKKYKLEAVYNTIHGAPGENGFLQGYLEIMKIPYSSSNLLTSAITFNKEVCKHILNKVPEMAHSKSLVINQKSNLTKGEILNIVGLPCFVKPNNGGSSVATAKVTSEKELEEAIKTALKEDSEVIIEEFIQGTEITCGVINYEGKIKALGITEIVAAGDFFDYHSKYVDKKTQEITPARIPKDIYERCERISEYIYKELQCKGIIRIDYIIKNNELYFLEVNTTPGMTDRSIIPQQAEKAGIPILAILTECLEKA